MLISGEGWLKINGLALQHQDGHGDDNMPGSQHLAWNADLIRSQMRTGSCTGSRDWIVSDVWTSVLI